MENRNTNLIKISNIARGFVWLKRINHCRGFGIQSPWAFTLARDVINERNRYYAYDILKQEYPNTSSLRRKLAQLYLRLSNFSHPKVIVDYGVQDEVYGAYLRTGSKKAKYICIPFGKEENTILGLLDGLENIDLVRITPFGDLSIVTRILTSRVHDGTLLIIEGIGYEEKAKKLWKEILNNYSNVTTFDLYYCGLVFFDEKRYKQNYIINF